MAQILEKTSIWKFGIFAKNICQIMTNCMDKHYLPNFSQILFGKFMAKRALIYFNLVMCDNKSFQDILSNIFYREILKGYEVGQTDPIKIMF